MKELKRYNDGTFAPLKKNPNSPRIIDICMKIFTKNKNKPLYVKDLYKIMKTKYGWKTTSKTPTQTIAGRLFVDYRFVKTDKNTFVLDSGFYNARKNNFAK